MSRIHKLWPSWLLLIGLALIFIGERIFGASDSLRPAFAAAGGGAIAAAIVGRALEWMAAASGDAPGERRPVLQTLLICAIGVGVSMALYAMIPLVFTGDDDGSARLRGVLWVAWPIILVMSGFVLVFLEAAVSPVAYIDRYERAAVRRSTIRGLALSLFLAVLFVGNYLAVQHDQKLETGASASAVPSAQTRDAVRDLTEKVRVVLFYPRANDVGERVEQYFKPLKDLNENLVIERLDHALASELARDAKVTENGYVALYRDKSDDKIRVGLDYRSARASLRRFDNSFLKSLIRVTTRRKTAYFYTGHDERPFGTPARDDNRATLRKLKTQLENWQFTVKPFSVGNGSTAALPDDADIVFVMGPEKPFLDAEIEVLTDALSKGVRLFVALEGERTGDPLDPLLAPLGLKFDSTLLAAPASNIPVTKTRADRSNLYSNQFSTHPSVTTMTRNTGKIAAIFQKTGSLSVQKESRLPKAKTAMVLTSLSDVFADNNGNLERDSGESKRSFGLAAAVTITSTTGQKTDEGRVFVLSDVDVMADGVFNLLPGNIYFLRDVVLWLQREPEVFVPTSRETDVKILHKGAEDGLVFYGTTLAVPTLLLLFGAYITRRRRR